MIFNFFYVCRIDEKHLICGKCKQFLTFPIKLHAELGNVCGDCFLNENIEGQLISNTPFENLLSDLECLIPCKNKNYGCMERFKLDRKCEHEKKCTFARIKCCFPSCSCKGQLSMVQFTDHINKVHRDSANVNNARFFFILLFPGSKFSLTGLCLSKLLISKNQHFLFDFKANYKSKRLSIKLVSLDGGIWRDDHYNLIVNINNKTEQIILSSTSIWQPNNSNVGIGLLWKENFEGANVLCILEKKEKEEHTSIPTDYLTEMFDCPICENLMKPPIYMCQLGHSICKNCKPKLETCPTCRKPFGDSRNFLVENLFNKIQFPCTFHPCSYKNYGDKIIVHELTCEFRKFLCLFCAQNAYDSGDCVKDLKSHIEAAHTIYKCEIGNKIYISRYAADGSLTNLCQTSLKMIMFYDDEIFRFTYCYGSPDLVFSMEMLGEDLEKKEYIFEVSIRASSASKKNVYGLNRSFIVGPEMQGNSSTLNSIKIPLSSIKSLIPVKIMDFCVEIYKKTDYVI